MIVVEKGNIKERFVSYINDAISKLADERYQDFLAMFDESRLSEQDLLFALRYGWEDKPILKIDDHFDPGDIGEYKNGSGYWADFDLYTEGERNDLTLHVEFLSKENGYSCVLLDLHVM